MAGTTPGGAFRFPYSYDTMPKDHDDFVSHMMDRDRALEDYLTAGRFPFKVVASDGSGDYTSIKTAIEAQPAFASGVGGSVIVVKQGTYADAGLGRVAPQVGAKVTIVSTFPFGQSVAFMSSATPPPYQAWTYDGLACPASGDTQLTLVGLDAQSGSASVIDNGAGIFTLNVQNGKLNGTGSIHDAFTVLGQRNYGFDDAKITVQFLTNSVPFGRVGAIRTHFSNFAPGTLSVPSFNSSNSVDPTGSFVSCLIENIGTLTMTGDTNFDLGTLEMDSCILNGTQMILGDIGTLLVTGCGGTLGSLQVHNGTVAGAGVRTSLTGNSLNNCQLKLTGNGPNSAAVQGTYNRLILDNSSAGGGAVVNVDLLATADSQTLLTISGDNNNVTMVVSDDGHGSLVAVNASGNNNIVTVSGSGTITNTGTGNYINSLPPAGNAGGDLAGTYPSPTVKNLTAVGNFDAKGDLLVATADNTPARLAIGADAKVLTADSAQTTGMKWATPAAVPAISGTASASQPGDSEADGASATGSPSDHKHSREAFFGPNLLDRNTESIEDDATGWGVGATCTIAQSGAQFRNGAHSLAMTHS